MAWMDPFEPLVSQLTRTPAFVPAVDVTVSEGDLMLTMDVPGLTRDDLSLELVGGQLIVRGERRPQQGPEVGTFAHRERTFGKFERRIKVPEGVEPDTITAGLDNGVLSLIVPRPERTRPRTISISVGGGGEGRAVAAAQPAESVQEDGAENGLDVVTG